MDINCKNPITLPLISFVVLVSLVVNFSAFNMAMAIAAVDENKFNKADFMIKDYGVGDDGNPFLTVEGKAGETIPQKENTGYAYVFVTDKGTYGVTSDWMYTKWHTHKLNLDDENCVESMDMNSGVGADVHDVVKVTNTNATNLNKIMTAEFTINNHDGSICATKVFDSAP